MKSNLRKVGDRTIPLWDYLGLLAIRDREASKKPPSRVFVSPLDFFRMVSRLHLKVQQVEGKPSEATEYTLLCTPAGVLEVWSKPGLTEWDEIQWGEAESLTEPLVEAIEEARDLGVLLFGQIELLEALSEDDQLKLAQVQRKRNEIARNKYGGIRIALPD